MKYRVIIPAMIAVLVSSLFVATSASAQKIIRVHSIKKPVVSKHIRVRAYGTVRHRRGKIRFRSFRRALDRNKPIAFALPDQRLFPPYYAHPRPWVQRPDLASRIRGGLTVRQGSPYASKINGGKTVQGGSVYASRIAGGRSVQGGSRYGSRIAAGKSVEQGSRWSSKMPNWRFSGYAAPMRPRGIPYYRPARKRSPWASRL